MALGVLALVSLALPGVGTIAAITFIGLPLALAYWAAPYLTIATLLRRLDPGADVRATYKLVGALMFFPAWWLGTAALLAWLTSWWAGALLLALSPLAGHLALRFAEDYLVAWREVRAFARIDPARRGRRMRRLPGEGKPISRRRTWRVGAGIAPVDARGSGCARAARDRDRGPRSSEPHAGPRRAGPRRPRGRRI